MRKLWSPEFHIVTYHFGIIKTTRISFTIVMFRVPCIQGHVIGPFNFFVSRLYLSNGLLSDLNGDHMHKLCPQEVDVLAYHFVVQKNIRILS